MLEESGGYKVGCPTLKAMADIVPVMPIAGNPVRQMAPPRPLPSYPTGLALRKSASVQAGLQYD